MSRLDNQISWLPVSIQKKYVAKFGYPNSYNLQHRKFLGMTARKYAEHHKVVVMGYWKECKGVNLNHLYVLWCEESDCDASDDWEVVQSDTQFLPDILMQFRDCPHVAAWILGDRMEDAELKSILESLPPRISGDD